MKRFMIERDIEGIGSMSTIELCGASKASNQALAELSPKAQWQHSYVAANNTFCIYLADNEETVRKHAELSGIPISKITEISQIIDPITANN